MYKWETKFQHGDIVKTSEGEGIINTIYISGFLPHKCRVSKKMTKNMRDNGNGHYSVSYDVSPRNGDMTNKNRCHLEENIQMISPGYIG